MEMKIDGIKIVVIELGEGLTGSPYVIAGSCCIRKDRCPIGGPAPIE